jgi:hypothetical protein
MRRLSILGGAAVFAAGALASIPAVLGLAGNPSFSQQVPVRPPEHARVLELHQSQPTHAVSSAAARAVADRKAPSTARAADDRSAGLDDRPAHPRDSSGIPHRSREAEPGDDRGSDRSLGRDRHGRGGHHSGEDG